MRYTPTSVLLIFTIMFNISFYTTSCSSFKVICGKISLIRTPQSPITLDITLVHFGQCLIIPIWNHTLVVFRYVSYSTHAVDKIFHLLPHMSVCCVLCDRIHWTMIWMKMILSLPEASNALLVPAQLSNCKQYLLVKESSVEHCQSWQVHHQEMTVMMAAQIHTKGTWLLPAGNLPDHHRESIILL